MKHCKVLIEPIAENKHKKKGTKADNKVVHVEREEERDPEVEMMVRKRWTKEDKKTGDVSTKAILLEEDTENK